MKIGIPLSNSKTQYFLNQAYVKYVAEAGFVPILISPELPTDVALSMVDGLLLPGGIDLDPIYYGEDNSASYSVDPDKDKFERSLFHAARKLHIPIFGICRGFQLIIREYMEHNPAMYDFLEFRSHIKGHNQVNDQELPRNIHQHFVNYVPKMLYGDNGTNIDVMPVNSMHHQCLITDFKREGVIGTGNFRMAAWTVRGLMSKKQANSCPLVCEAFKILKWGAPILAVQWHPEEIRDHTLIKQFFNKYSENKSPLEANG